MSLVVVIPVWLWIFLNQNIRNFPLNHFIFIKLAFAYTYYRSTASFSFQPGAYWGGGGVPGDIAPFCSRRWCLHPIFSNVIFLFFLKGCIKNCLSTPHEIDHNAEGRREKGKYFYLIWQVFTSKIVHRTRIENWLASLAISWIKKTGEKKMRRNRKSPRGKKC